MLDNAPDVTVAMRCSRENPGCRGRRAVGSTTFRLGISRLSVEQT